MSADVQWTDDDPDTGEKRFLHAGRFAGKWTIKVRHRRRENWRTPHLVTRGMWESLLEALERRLPRREGVTDDDIRFVKKALAELPAEEHENPRG